MGNLTIVTGLFDIGRDQLEGQFKRNFSDYLGWFDQTLKIDLPMIIHCNTSLEEFITERRNSLNTEIVYHPDNFLDRFKYYRQIQKIRNDPNWYEQTGWLLNSPQGALPRYNPLVMSKQYLLADDIKWNTFDTNYFLWLDAGVSHTTDISLFAPPFEERILEKMEDKLLYLYFPYRQSEAHGFNTKGLDKFAHNHVDRVVRATMFGGPKKLLYDTTRLYDQLLEETLNARYMGTEENILTLISYLIPKNCNLFMIKDGFIKYFLETLHE